MPYIKQNRRNKIDASINDLIGVIKSLDYKDLRDLDGDMNYTITKLILGILDLVENPKYTKFNTSIGVLESVKLELYRRFVSEYEDEKIKENNDII